MKRGKISKKQIDDTVDYLLEIAEDDEFYCFNFNTEFQQRKFIEHANKFRGIANLLKDTYNELNETSIVLDKAVQLMKKMKIVIDTKEKSETECNIDVLQCDADVLQCNADVLQCNADVTKRNIEKEIEKR